MSVQTVGDRREALPVILLPGMLCDDRAFAPLMARLAGRDVRTMLPTGAATAAVLASRLLAEAPARFVLIGFSLGGIVALEMAAQAPARVAGLALVGSTARADRPHLAEGRRALVADARARGVAAMLMDNFWPRYVAAGALDDEDLQFDVLDMAAALGVDAFAEQSEVVISRADSRGRLKNFAMPVLALCGADDALCPPLLSEEIAAAAPNATLAVIPGAGHFVLLETPRLASDAVLAWLDSVPTPSH